MTRKRLSFKHPVVRIAFSLLVLILLFVAFPFADVAAAVGSVPLGVWPLALTVYLMLHFIGIIKWRTLINAAGAGLTLREAARAYYMGLFGNTFLPSVVGGDVVRAGVAMSHTTSKSGLILGSFADRLLDVLGLAAVSGIGALLSPRALDDRSRRIFVTLGVVLGVLGAVALIALWLAPVKRFPFKVRRRLVAVRRAVRATASQPGALLTAFSLGMLLQISLTAMNWLLGRSMGIDIPLYVWLFVWPLAKIAALLPLTQNGIGVREAAQAALFAPFGVAGAKAVASGLVFAVVIVTGGILAGGLAFLLSKAGGERRALRGAGRDGEVEPTAT